MEYKEVDLQKAIPIWWSMTWRFLLASTIASIVVGGLSGYILGIAGSPEYGAISGALGVLISVPVGVWSMKAALSKKYNGYSVVLVKSP